MAVRCSMNLIHCLTAEPDQVAEVWQALRAKGWQIHLRLALCK